MRPPGCLIASCSSSDRLLPYPCRSALIQHTAAIPVPRASVASGIATDVFYAGEIQHLDIPARVRARPSVYISAHWSPSFWARRSHYLFLLPVYPIIYLTNLSTMEPAFQNLESLPYHDRRLFIEYGKGRSKPRPFTLVHKAVEHIADIQPELPAAQYNGTTITYGELDRQANRISNSLIQSGLQPRERVCVVVQRSIPMLVAILAVLKAGCQYVPIDGGVVTEEMLAHIFSDTQAPAILCLSKFEDKVKRNTTPTQQTHVIDAAQSEDVSAERPNVDVNEKDGCYIIYTSGMFLTMLLKPHSLTCLGTTGMPKGVDVAHGNVTNTLCLSPADLDIVPGTKVSQVLNISFDMGKSLILLEKRKAILTLSSCMGDSGMSDERRYFGSADLRLGSMSARGK